MIAANSCVSLSYYHQSISGHLDIIKKSRPVKQLLADESISEELRNKLKLSMKIRKYASEVLMLPDNESYSSYVDLGRNYVVWNVVATPEFSLKPLDWCYLIVGCLSYRGYFSMEDAVDFAGQLKSEGYDVHVAGVTAYSTLGWFADPLINTMLRTDATHLARVIFHELAHQLIYFANDTEFNEAFAETVADYGVRLWLEDEGLIPEIKEFERTRARETDFNSLVEKYRENLEKLYQSNLDKSEMRLNKASVFDYMKSEYETLRRIWDDPDDYQAWFSSGLNNAKLALVLTYKDLMPGFLHILTSNNYDLEQFYRIVSALQDCDQTTRRDILKAKKTGWTC